MKERAFGLDLIKFLACLFVIAAHFFLYTYFYTVPLAEAGMFLQVCARWFFVICIPLFLITTGYLQNEKRITKKYYLSILPLLATYVFIAVCCVLFSKYSLGQEIGWFQGILAVLNFSAIPYGWYVEMFVGLYLLIPFLNTAYNSLHSARHKLLLIGVLLFLSSGTSLLQNFTVQGNALDVSTNWWESLYPLTCYFIGAYIHETQLRLSNRQKACGIAVILLMIVMESYVSAYQKPIFDLSKFAGNNTIYIVVAGVLFFLMVYRVNIRNKLIRSVVTGVAKRTLDIYLFSYIFDQIYYPWFRARFFHDIVQFSSFILVIVPIVMISSFAASWLKGLLFKGAVNLARQLRGQRRQDIAAGG